MIRSGSASIADLGRAVTEVRYFGDLDENGLRIPASAGLMAERAGLPPVRPATGLYSAMFAQGNPRPGQRRVPADTAASLVAWLDPEHQDEAAQLLGVAVKLGSASVLGCRRGPPG